MEQYFKKVSEAKYRMVLLWDSKNSELFGKIVQEMDELRLSPVLNPDLFPGRSVERVEFYSMAGQAHGLLGSMLRSRLEVQIALRDIERSFREIELFEDSFPVYYKKNFGILQRIKAQFVRLLESMVGSSKPPSAGAEEGRETRERVARGGDGFETDRWPTTEGRSRTAADRSRDPATSQASPFSGANAQANAKQPRTTITKPLFSNPEGSLPNKSPATAPAKSILPASANDLDNTARRPSVNSDFFDNSSLPPFSGAVKPASGLEERPTPTLPININKNISGINNIPAAGAEEKWQRLTSDVLGTLPMGVKVRHSSGAIYEITHPVPDELNDFRAGMIRRVGAGFEAGGVSLGSGEWEYLKSSVEGKEFYRSGSASGRQHLGYYGGPVQNIELAVPMKSGEVGILITPGYRRILVRAEQNGISVLNQESFELHTDIHLRKDAKDMEVQVDPSNWPSDAKGKVLVNVVDFGKLEVERTENGLRFTPSGPKAEEVRFSFLKLNPLKPLDASAAKMGEVDRAVVAATQFFGQEALEWTLPALVQAQVVPVAPYFKTTKEVSELGRVGISPFLVPNKLKSPSAAPTSSMIRLLVEPWYRERIRMEMAGAAVEIVEDPALADFVIGSPEFVRTQRAKPAAAQKLFLQLDHPGLSHSITPLLLSHILARRDLFPAGTVILVNLLVRGELGRQPSSLRLSRGFLSISEVFHLGSSSYSSSCKDCQAGLHVVSYPVLWSTLS